LANGYLKIFSVDGGGLEEIVTDNGPPFIAAVNWLNEKYGIHHIRITPYNSQANLVERHHYDVREALIKSCCGDIAHWYKYLPHIFWAEHVTIQRSTGYSPFWMCTGTEPVLPFDIDEATWLVTIPGDSGTLETEELISMRAQALQKCEEDLAALQEKVYNA
jgi:hypothetical protein